MKLFETPPDGFELAVTIPDREEIETIFIATDDAVDYRQNIGVDPLEADINTRDLALRWLNGEQPGDNELGFKKLTDAQHLAGTLSTFSEVTQIVYGRMQLRRRVSFIDRMITLRLEQGRRAGRMATELSGLAEVVSVIGYVETLTNES